MPSTSKTERFPDRSILVLQSAYQEYGNPTPLKSTQTSVHCYSNLLANEIQDMSTFTEMGGIRIACTSEETCESLGYKTKVESVRPKRALGFLFDYYVTD